MSYNVDTWKTKRLEGLIVPLKAFFRHERSDWHPKIAASGHSVPRLVRLDCGCDQSIDGQLDNDMLAIEVIDMAGEESTGILEAILIWEGGESIERLSVFGGKITREEIDL